MTQPSPTPLESWIRDRISASRLDVEAIRGHQLSKLRETISHTHRNSPFYARHLLAHSEDDIRTLDDLQNFPFTTPADLIREGLGFLCVSQDAVERVVTLETSGTTGDAKRIFFTGEDLERTIDFFACGMSDFVTPGGRVLILLPGDRPDSVGDLLVRGLRRIGAEGIVHGPVRDPKAALNAIQDLEIECIIGIPVQVLAMARSGRPPTRNPVKNVILTTDHVPDAVVRAVESAWECRVFNHYGMTEMGYGGGLECSARTGYHLREADLFFEIVDPATGRNVPDGNLGEVVFTTLTRKGMPLIRYRTGDLSRFLPEPCACGAGLRRMDRVRTRIAGITRLNGGGRLTMADLDEALFPIPNLIDFRAELVDGGRAGASMDRLVLTLHLNGGKHPIRADRLDTEDSVHATDPRKAIEAAERRLSSVPSLGRGLAAGMTTISALCFDEERTVSAGAAKRLIMDKRKIRP